MTVTMHWCIIITEERYPEKLLIMLLSAAGERVSSTNFEKENGPVRSLKLLYQTQSVDVCLKSMYRMVIRKHLLQLNAHLHSFGRVSSLPLPPIMISFLLYDVALDAEIP